MLPIPLTVLLTLLREILRTLAVPAHALAYYVRRHAARRQCREILAHWLSAGANDALEQFLRRCPPRRSAQPHVFVSAGEASGEAHAARLVRAVQQGTSVPIRFTCFGGAELAATGARVVVPLSRQAIMGYSGVLKAAPFLVSVFARFLRVLRDERPDLVVLVDYPGLHLVMAKAARRAGIPVIHYIAPQYWAWAPWRMTRYRGCVDACLAILPFEPAFFRNSGVPCEYVGHPLLDSAAADPPQRPVVATLRADHWLCLLPGSRGSEIERHLPGMLRVARRLREQDRHARVLLAHRDAQRETLIRGILQREGADFVEFALGHVSEKIAAAHVVLAKSGTGSLEAALAGTPTVVVYRVSNAFMSFLYRNYLTVPWFAAANLIAARAVLAERCFHTDDGWDWASKEVAELWSSAPARLRCLDHLAEVQHRLGEPGASARAAHWVLAALGHERAETA